VFRPGPKNLITDIAGLKVGHSSDEKVRSGVTALLCGAAWPAGVDVRGGGPGGRETDVLSPENLVGRAHAVVFAGGSVFGLAAADGVAAALSARGIGLQLRPGTPPVPIVPSAVLYDLGNGGDKNWGLAPPYRDLGIRALEAAGGDFALGSAGAGRGAMAGLNKGGIGSTSLDLGGGLLVGALAAVNSVGSALMPDGKTYWAWAFELDREFGGGGAPRESMDLSDPAPDESRLLPLGRLQTGANTTLGVVACTADLTTAECKRVAMMAQDGIARAVRPAHTPFDGDTIFALASGALRIPVEQRAAEIGRIGSAAADCLSRAIARAVYFADPRSTAQGLTHQAGGKREHRGSDQHIQNLPRPRPRKKRRQ
jgi:L-aminopeptidase/D-esterase-like protein